MHRKVIRFLCGALIVAAPALAQTIEVGDLDCLPNEFNSSISASVQPEVGGSDQVRLHFRRLNPTGAYYWVTMNPAGEGRYWTVFPKPEQREQQRLTDEWWQILEKRDWMAGRDREWLDNWLEQQQFEAAEYFVSVVDVAGRELARSKASLVEVRDRNDCRVSLDAFEQGQARNLTVGEKTEAQRGHELYHWLCDGVVSRVDFEGVLREDEICRACVVAAWLPVVPAGAALIAGTTIEKREPRRVSEVQP